MEYFELLCLPYTEGRCYRVESTRKVSRQVAMRIKKGGPVVCLMLQKLKGKTWGVLLFTRRVKRMSVAHN